MEKCSTLSYELCTAGESWYLSSDIIYEAKTVQCCGACHCPIRGFKNAVQLKNVVFVACMLDSYRQIDRCH